MHGACGVIDNRMDTKIFEQLRKVKIICKTAMVCKKMKNAIVMSLTPHAKYDTACTIDSNGPGSL
jgi:hypothetical protein